jgi:hypothetical protein
VAVLVNGLGFLQTQWTLPCSIHREFIPNSSGPITLLKDATKLMGGIRAQGYRTIGKRLAGKLRRASPAVPAITRKDTLPHGARSRNLPWMRRSTPRRLPG